MKTEDKRFLLPGDLIGTSEEYIAGEGTFERDGHVYSSNTGYLEIDSSEMIVRVKAATSTPVILKDDDIVYGLISDIRGSMAFIDLAKVVGKDRPIATGDTQASLHISKIQKEFIKDMGRAYKVGDVIRAKVIQVEPSLQISTQGPNLGVIIANCLECLVTLERKGTELICPKCEKHYRRKLAADYGEVEKRL